MLVRHKDRVQAFINKLIVNRPESEDLVLMSFDKAFRNLRHYNPKFAFSTWLYSIVQNLCIDYFRKNKQYFVSLEEASDTVDINPEEVLIAEQQRQALESLITQLKPEYREVIWLRYMQHYAYEEIAHSCKSLWARSKQGLTRQVMLGNYVQEGKSGIRMDATHIFRFFPA